MFGEGPERPRGGGPKIGKRRVPRLGTGNDHDVDTRPGGEITDRRAEGFAKTAPRSIPRDSAAQRTRGRDGDTDHVQSVWAGAKCEETMPKLPSVAPHRGDVRVPPQTRGVHE